MPIKEQILSHFEKTIGVKEKMAARSWQEIKKAALAIVETYFRHGGTVFACGNGGSAADAQHLSGELFCMLRKHHGFERRFPLAAHALSTDASTVTAIANDIGYDFVFSRQLEALATPKDLVIGFSTSGQSSNVARALKLAKNRGIRTIAFTGKKGGKIAEIADIVIKVPSNDVVLIQEAHQTCFHIICDIVEQILFGESFEDALGKQIVSTAPTRIGLMGGGTDVEPYAGKHNGQVLNIATNLKHTAQLIPKDSDEINIYALNKHIKFRLKDKLVHFHSDKIDLVKAVYNHFQKDLPSGFDLSVNYGGSTSSGLGTSGSAAVAIIGAFLKWTRKIMDPKDIAELAFYIENNILGWKTGRQDQIAASFGGLNLIQFGAGDFEVKPINVPKKTLKKMRQWITLVYIGGWRNSANLQENLIKGMKKEKSLKALHKLRDMVPKAVKLIKAGDFDGLGTMIGQSWFEKKKSNPAVANKQIDRLYDLGIKKGAVGGKLVGAGGAGHLLFFCPPRKQKSLQKTMLKQNLQVVDFDFDFAGLEVEIRE